MRSPASANNRPRSCAAVISSTVQPCSVRNSSSSRRSSAPGASASYSPAATQASTLIGPERLPGLAVERVRPAVRTELLHLEPVGVVAPVLLGDVVAVLALVAGQRDLRPDVGGCHGADLPGYERARR